MVKFRKIDELVWRKIDADGETSNEKGVSFLLRYYRVFNVEQCDDLKALWRRPQTSESDCRARFHRGSDVKSVLIF
jgi:hypothetical protein